MRGALLTFPDMVKSASECPNRIREWRKARKMRLVELAARVGSTATQLSRMETGERPVTIEWLQRIARPLNVTPGELLRHEDNPLLPAPREAELLYKLREGGERSLRTAEALAEAQRAYIAPPADLYGDRKTA